jgi:hypothetical protein
MKMATRCLCEFGSFQNPAKGNMTSKPPPFQCLRTAFTMSASQLECTASTSHTLGCPTTTHYALPPRLAGTGIVQHSSSTPPHIKFTYMSSLPYLQILFLFLKDHPKLQFAPHLSFSLLKLYSSLRNQGFSYKPPFQLPRIFSSTLLI